MSIIQWHVLQDELEQVAQPLPVDLRRLAPPPMPKPETSLFTSRPPQARQQTPFSPPMRTSVSNRRPHA
jgi:hypothetical protein